MNENKQVIYLVEVGGVIEDVIADVPGVWLHTDTLDELGECPVCRGEITILNDESEVCTACKINWSSESTYPDYEWLVRRVADLVGDERAAWVHDILVRGERKGFGRD